MEKKTTRPLMDEKQNQYMRDEERQWTKKEQENTSFQLLLRMQNWSMILIQDESNGRTAQQSHIEPASSFLYLQTELVAIWQFVLYS